MGKQKPKKNQRRSRPASTNTVDWDAYCRDKVRDGLLPPTVLSNGVKGAS
jgi:hypothetical protein